MSRHVHTIERDGVKYEVACGYDRPLQEFFLQVFPLDENGQDDEPLFCIGNYYTMKPHPRNPGKLTYTNAEIMELMEEWGVYKQHIEMVGWDLAY